MAGDKLRGGVGGHRAELGVKASTSSVGAAGRRMSPFNP